MLLTLSRLRSMKLEWPPFQALLLRPLGVRARRVLLQLQQGSPHMVALQMELKQELALV
jgi:hypothetical protein